MSVAEFENFLDPVKHISAVQCSEVFSVFLIDENLRITQSNLCQISN
jgi:hypothetical protein